MKTFIQKGNKNENYTFFVHALNKKQIQIR